MNEELFLEITTGNLVYLSSFVLVGLVLALITQLMANRLKTKLRRINKTNLIGQLVDEVDGPLALWILLAGVYIGLLGLPPLADHSDVMKHGFTVVSIVVAVFGGIRAQGDVVSWLIRRAGRRSGQAKVLNSLVPMAKRITAIAILVIGILIILDQLGIAIAPLVAGLGIGGLAVALALQSTFTNFFAGFNVLTDGSIRVGDFVELEGGMRGEVDQIGWRTTRIRMMANNMVIIPNSRLAESIATNFNFPTDEMSLYVEVGVAYSSDLEHVERVTVEVAKEVMASTPGSVQEYQPSIWYTGFGDSNIDFWVVLRAHGYMDSWLVKHNFIKALLKRYNQEGIEISFPARNIFMRNGVETTRPPETMRGGSAT